MNDRHRSRRASRAALMLALVALLALGACHRGGSHAPSTPAANGNWDGLVWDQDNWS